MAFNFANVLIFSAVAVGLVFIVLLLGKLLRPDVPDPEKATIYECGERPIGPAWFAFNPRFYIVALIFVIFDVEVVFMFPVIAVFRRWMEAGFGMWAYLEITIFVAILAAGLAYVWRTGDLAWVKKTVEDATHRRQAPETGTIRKAA